MDKNYHIKILLSIKAGIKHLENDITDEQKKAILNGLDLVINHSLENRIVTQEEFDDWDKKCILAGLSNMGQLVPDDDNQYKKAKA